MSRDRSESVQSVVASLNSSKDDVPLYYCDRDIFAKPPNTTKRAVRALYAASALATLFIIAEVIGGYLANSLAIMTDAGHMISDLVSFFFSLAAIQLARKKPTQRYSFGYHRAEVLGAVTSILLIWALTAVLVYLAILRIVNDNYEVNADFMLITASVGILFNLVMGAVLHLGNSGHMHFGVSSHNHAHDGNQSHHNHAHDEEEGVKKDSSDATKDLSHDRNNNKSKSAEPKAKGNINVRAAFIHVLGDLVQSVGVLVAALVIKFTGWKYADPICTFIFSILVLITTITVLKDTLVVLMEAAPRNLDVNALHLDLRSIEGVRDVHSLRVWSLTMDKTAISVHLDTEKDCDSNHVVHEANERLRSRHGINYITVQVQCVCSRSISMQTLVPHSISSTTLSPTAEATTEQV